MPELIFPIVTYDEHPAFSSLAPSYSGNFAERVGKVVLEIELVAEQLATRGQAGRRAPLQGKLADLIGELSGLIARETAIDSALRDALLEGVKRTYDSLLKQTKYEQTRKPPKTSAPNGDALSTLRSEGAVAINLPREAINELRGSFAGIVSELRAKTAKSPLTRNIVSLKKGSPEFGKVEEIMRSHGLLALADGYHGHRMGLGGASVELSTPQAAWYRDCYADAGMPTSKSAYMHYDYEYDLQKFVVYLDEVTERNGPFCYILGSNKYEMPRFLFAFVKEFEQVAGKRGLFAAKPPYYRASFATPENRRLFMQIPSALRAASHFGDDLLDGTPVQQFLLQREKAFTTADGNCVMFDGHHGIHRGGLATDSERLAMFVTLRPHVTFFRRAMVSLRARLRRVGRRPAA